jgi:Ca2+-binding EF-hand superfamily protein
MLSKSASVRSWLAKRAKKSDNAAPTPEYDELQRYFDSFDEDGSGVVTVEELREPLMTLGLVRDEHELEEVFRMMDSDRSG